MKQSNKKFIIDYIRNDEYVKTTEERSQLIAALVGAVCWGEKIDEANRKYSDELRKKGVTYHAYPPE